MRFKEFNSGAAELKFVKFVFEKVLKQLKARYIKRLKIHKNEQRFAKQRVKNRRLQARMNTSTIGVKSPERPKRSE